MSPDKPRDMAASVKARLLQISRTRGEEFQNVFTRYAIERLLYRLSRSEHRTRFILKRRKSVRALGRGGTQDDPRCGLSRVWGPGNPDDGTGISVNLPSAGRGRWACV